MKQNKNTEMNGTKNEQEISQTQQNRLLICNVCGNPIDQLYKSEYLCEDCFKERNREYLTKHRQKIKLIYDGYYIYMIVDTRTNNPVYVGYSTNIHKRHSDHFTTRYNTTFSAYITENKLDNSYYEMIVLDLTAYRDSLTIDDVLLLEHFAIANNNLEYEILNEQGKEFDFTDDEIERIMYLYSMIDMSNYIEYNEIAHKKNTYQSLAGEIDKQF